MSEHRLAVRTWGLRTKVVHNQLDHGNNKVIKNFLKSHSFGAIAWKCRIKVANIPDKM